MQKINNQHAAKQKLQDASQSMVVGRPDKGTVSESLPLKKSRPAARLPDTRHAATALITRGA